MEPPDTGPPVRLVDDQWCFVCGAQNPMGLRLDWTLDADGMARARFHPGRQHQGWNGVVHGGILAALCDEAMAKRLGLDGIRALTARLSIRYRLPAPTDGVLIAEGRLVSRENRVMKLEAFVRGEDGRCYAEAEGTCVRPSS